MKSLFNFYLEDADKEALTTKLARLSGEQPKGQIAALLRVFIKLFLATPDEKISKQLIEALAAEYEYSQTRNKRSSL